MAEKEFAEEFLLSIIKTKQSKQAKRREKSIRKHREKSRRKVKEKEEIQKVSAQDFRPSLKPSLKAIVPPKTLPEGIPSPKPGDRDDLEAPEPPLKLVVDVPEIPEPPKGLSLPEPPKFFEPGAEQIRSLPGKVMPIIDLGKLNQFATDPNVETIQCDGPFMPVKIVKMGQTIDTKVELDEREINYIINQFAEKSSSKVSTPIFKSSVKGFMISAVISEFAGTKFIITKK
jgi:hypothetical protein